MTTPRIDGGEAVRFLKLIFGVGAGGYIGLWRLDRLASHWHLATDPEVCFRDIDRYAGATDVYFHVGLYAEATDTYHRGAAEGVSAIGGLWLDLDYLHDAHGKKNLPPDREVAREFIRTLPFQPTVVIHTGHGFQAWWLFRELWTFESDDDRSKAENLSRRWQYSIKDALKGMGWDADCTWDLARILRLPGTINHKVAADPVPVEIVEQNDDLRYNPSDFDEALPPENYEPINLDFDYDPGSLILDPFAVPPFDKHQAALENDSKFRATWDHKRKELPSASEYDFSLTSYGVMFGWDDQEIVDLCIAWRRKHGIEPKLRQEYYADGLRKIRGDKSRQQAMEIVDSGEVPEDRAPTLQLLSQLFGVPITGAIRRGSENARYSLLIDGVEVPVGTVAWLHQQQRVRDAIYEARGVSFLPCKPVRWLNALTLLSRVTMTVEMPDGGPVAETEAHLMNYTREIAYGFAGDAPWKDALPTAAPFVRDERVWVNVEALREHLFVHGIRADGNEIRNNLSRLGFTASSNGASGRPTGSSRVINLKYWRSPAGWGPLTNGHVSEDESL